jgi:heme A synthase
MSGGFSRFVKYAWFTLAYNIFVILFGAFVRASGSGAGCGAHWPLCNGVVIPRPERIETIIEFTHRITSGITIILVFILIAWAFRQYAPKTLPRRFAVFVGVFTTTEALVGAGLVLFQLVDKNTSVARAYSVMIHLVNTFLLLASITMTAWSASVYPNSNFTFNKVNGLLISLGCAFILLIGASGAITALGDTLFPSTSLAEGLQNDFSSSAHYLIRMRIYHPGIAVSVGIYLALVTMYFRRKYKQPRVEMITNGLFGLYLTQMALGIINVALLAPIWIQLIHLMVSCLIWVTFILLSSEILSSFLPGIHHKEIYHPVHEISR